MRIIQSEIIKPEKLRDELIARIAAQKGVPEGVVEKVVSFQFKDVNDKMKEVVEVEMIKLGVFKIKLPKLIKKIDKFETMLTNMQVLLSAASDPKKISSLSSKIKKIEEDVEYLRDKLSKCLAKQDVNREDKFERNLGRGVELIVREDINRGDCEGEK